MARIDIEIEDYLYEVDTKYLVNELRKRKDGINQLGLDPEEIEIPKFKTPDHKLRFIKLILGLRQWHDKERVISEIQSL